MAISLSQLDNRLTALEEAISKFSDDLYTAGFRADKSDLSRFVDDVERAAWELKEQVEKAKRKP